MRTCSIPAIQAANANYLPTTAVLKSLTLLPWLQRISFSGVGNPPRTITQDKRGS
ncbi:MAG TPA: hypothetical protein VN579_03445 [Bryobacteraceae bacterium]|nr:hypothetical protein [Bryobacteraceae bacterium]